MKVVGEIACVSLNNFTILRLIRIIALALRIKLNFGLLLLCRLYTFSQLILLDRDELALKGLKLVNTGFKI